MSNTLLIDDGSQNVTNKTIDAENNTVSNIGLDEIKTEVLAASYPVGSIYINATDSTNPATLLGFGTWSAFGAGRVPVGYDSADTDFDTAEKTGGAKTHTLTEAEMPSHNHSGSTGSAGSHNHSGSANGGGTHKHDQHSGTVLTDKTVQTAAGDNWYKVTSYGGQTNSGGYHSHSLSINYNGYHDHSVSIGNAGSDNAHNNLQPYITVYMWKRTA